MELFELSIKSEERGGVWHVNLRYRSGVNLLHGSQSWLR